MKKEQVLNLMNTVSPDLIEEADIQAPAKRRMPKTVRTGLIAACLCLALLGTAFAAANPEAVADFLSRFTPVQAESFTTEDGEARYHVSYEPIRYPIDSFNPALLAAVEDGWDAGIVEQRFDTWAEVRAFIGEDIPCYLPNTLSDGDGKFQVFLECTRDKLTAVRVTTSGTAPWAWLHIYTEYYSGDATGSARWAMFYESESEASAQLELLDPYSMANGCQAEIALFTAPADPKNPDAEDIQCVATFVQDGIQYQVLTGGSFR
ncbi:MAG: hypothetical protein K2M15_06435, partial [Oscillospiraceae bacterium]|nr:hypothetical protein [Oscillospiraceae bacterium]